MLVAPLWCGQGLGCCSRTVVVIKASTKTSLSVRLIGEVECKCSGQSLSESNRVLRAATKLFCMTLSHQWTSQ